MLHELCQLSKLPYREEMFKRKYILAIFISEMLGKDVELPKKLTMDKRVKAVKV